MRSPCPKILDLLREHLYFHVRKQWFTVLLTGLVEDPIGNSGFCVQVVSVVLAWAWGPVASPLMLPSSTEEVGEWATWAQEVSSLVS